MGCPGGTTLFTSMIHPAEQLEELDIVYAEDKAIHIELAKFCSA
jgi:hypothetical protein